MDDRMNGKLPPTRDARGRALVLPAAMREKSWKPGQSGNPSGRNGLYGEMLRRAREFTPEATDYLISIARDLNEETRNRIVAISLLYERAWGKAQPMVNEAEPDALKNMSPEQRLQRVNELLSYAATLQVPGAPVEAETNEGDVAAPGPADDAGTPPP
jgi:hypothetical protein